MNVRAEQPSYRRWTVFGAPLLILGVVVIGEIVGFRRFGFTSDILFLWLVLALMVLGVALPIWWIPQSVSANVEGLTLRSYFGSRRSIPWESIESVRVMPATKVKRRSLQVTMRGGRKLVLDEQLSNFSELLRFIEGAAKNAQP